MRLLKTLEFLSLAFMGLWLAPRIGRAQWDRPTWRPFFVGFCKVDTYQKQIGRSHSKSDIRWLRLLKTFIKASKKARQVAPILEISDLIHW